MTMAMKHVPIDQLRPAGSVESVYLLQELELKTKRNGDPFASLTFADSTGSLQGVMWDNLGPVINHDVAQNDFVLVSGEVGTFNNNLQLVVRRIAPVADAQVDLARFLPMCPQDLGELERRLDALIGEVKGDCRRLLDHFLGQGPQSLRRDFCSAPAAVRVHQAYIGGLLEHTLCVVGNALTLADRYKPYDRDLLITGALLHDLGKIREYDWRRVIRYTDEGRLIGHISIATGLYYRAFQELAPFDELLQWNLLHLLLSHHGKREYGSPVLPKTREAFLLHYADLSDAYLAIFVTETDKAREKGEAWTGFNKLFDTYLYSGATRADGALPLQRPANLEPDDPRFFFGSGGDSVDDPGR